MLKSKQRKILNEVYQALNYALSSIHSGQYGEKLFSMLRKEELKHRKFCPAGIVCCLSVSEAVKIFFCRDIIEGLQGKYNFTVKDILNIRPSVLFAHSLALNYREELQKAIENLPFNEVLGLNYADLIKE